MALDDHALALLERAVTSAAPAAVGASAGAVSSVVSRLPNITGVRTPRRFVRVRCGLQYSTVLCRAPNALLSPYL